MSERLTKKFCGGYGLVKVRDDEQEVDSPYKNTLQSILECFERLGKIEDVLYDADGNEVISLDRLRELAEDEAKGRSTGFSDRNGTIIREHDIVRVTFYDKDFKREYVREECEVIFEKGAFGFIWGNRKEFNPLCSFCVGTVVFFEIIGHAAADAGKGE